MKRKKRKGEHTCECKAYPFPHRFGGGKCNGFYLVVEQWEKTYGQGICKTCNCLNENICEVVEGQEAVSECEAWQEFTNFNEIRVYEK